MFSYQRCFNNRDNLLHCNSCVFYSRSLAFSVGYSIFSLIYMFFGVYLLDGVFKM